MEGAISEIVISDIVSPANVDIIDFQVRSNEADVLPTSYAPEEDKQLTEMMIKLDEHDALDEEAPPEEHKPHVSSSTEDLGLEAPRKKQIASRTLTAPLPLEGESISEMELSPGVEEAPSKSILEESFAPKVHETPEHKAGHETLTLEYDDRDEQPSKQKKGTDVTFAAEMLPESTSALSEKDIEIVEPLTAQMVELGADASFECQLSDDYDAVTWLKDAEPLVQSAKYEVIHEGTFHKVVVHKVERTDSGEYSIRVGEAVSAATLEVEGMGTNNIASCLLLIRSFVGF